MAFVHADRVKETSTTTGTGTYSLAGAVAGFRTFVAGVATTNRCVYCVENGTDWEINEGVITDATPDTLTRDKLIASSTGSAINWSAGTRNVFAVCSALDQNPKTKYLASPHTLASGTGTEVTGLELVDLRPGTYNVTYWLLCQSSVTTTGIGLGLNFTGTAAGPVINLRHCSTGAAAATGVIDGVANVLTGSLVEGRAAIAYSTTAPNMLNAGYAVITENALIIIEAVIIVTAAGNLELWHSSETANNTSVSAGSSVVCLRVN